MAFPSSRSLTRPASSRIVRVPDVTRSPSTRLESSAPIAPVEYTRPIACRSRNATVHEKLQRSLREAVQSMQGSCGTPGDERVGAEIQQAREQPPTPAQRTPSEVECVRPIGHKQPTRDTSIEA